MKQSENEESTAPSLVGPLWGDEASNSIASSVLPSMSDVNSTYGQNLSDRSAAWQSAPVPLLIGEDVWQDWVRSRRMVTLEEQNLLGDMRNRSNQSGVILDSIFEADSGSQPSRLTLEHMDSGTTTRISRLLESFHRERRQAMEMIARLSQVISEQNKVISPVAFTPSSTVQSLPKESDAANRSADITATEPEVDEYPLSAKSQARVVAPKLRESVTSVSRSVGSEAHRAERNRFSKRTLWVTLCLQSHSSDTISPS